MKINKTKLNYIVDVSLAVLFILVAATGLVLFFFLPGGLKQGGTREALGLTKQVWTQIHNLSGLALMVFIAWHLILHRKWITYITKNIFQKNK